MSLVDILTRGPAGRGRKLLYFVVLDNLTEEEQTAITLRFENPDVPASWLARVLTEVGHPISASSIQSARRQAGVIA